MRYLVLLGFLGLLLGMSSCRTDFDFVESTGKLQFSRDTVYLDTVFSGIGSSTYTLKVYNKTNTNIRIPSIGLAKGNLSKYRMTVDGMTENATKSFANVELLAKDSLYIFIETTANIVDTNVNDFLYTDQIVFGNGTQAQKVELVTLIQDAYFIFPNKIDGVKEAVDFGFDEEGNVTQVIGRNLQENHPDNGNEYVWNNTKPYVVYGYASVPDGKTLTVNPGARIHFHKDSGIIVQEGGTLNIAGTPSISENMENEVIFEGDRLEPDFAETPGQWGFIYLRQGSKNHSINHLSLKNATIGIYVENNFGTPLTVKNTQIYNSSVVGILGRFARIDGFNVVINSRTRGVGALACTWGGTYNFTHSTFNNQSSSSTQFAVIIDNYFEDANGNKTAFDLTAANFTNCIIYGSNNRQFILSKNDSKTFNYKFTNCLLKFNNSDPSFNGNLLYDFENTNLYTNCIIAKNNFDFKADFLNPTQNKLQIGLDSAAKGAADFSVSTGTSDILGVVRNNPSDIGAYNAIEFPAE
ncbi:hypothetical protein [Flavobacterium sp.]|uniref:hypothetical protein n=1 Tax=Flavobacterium sp. TaxID=239 RepID=UPI00262588EB|nr:hypothetical protein [Flavobacterium sp.]MDD3005393.1 hypothetical protein [Flavobacterium sp.]